ncbi:MAG: right-handed parallel beta-helix repeat-containing protein [Melioribacteraceae bacterium]
MNLQTSILTKYIILFLFVGNLYAGGNKRIIYISPSGSDTNSGSIESPLASINKAKELIRSLKSNSPETQFVVYLRNGIYRINNTIDFNEKDSGLNKSIVYSAYKNEEVRISGGIIIQKARINNKIDSSIANRFITRVRDKILQIDYSALNIDEGKINPHGFGRPYSVSQMELFSGNRAYSLARYPNKGFVPYTKVIDEGGLPFQGDYSDRGGILEYDISRPKRWIHADEPWISGYFRYGFADDAVALEKIDTVQKRLYTKQSTFYGFSIGEIFNSFYAFNLLEEIDQPGEYYIDKKKKLIYFYPFDKENIYDMTLSIAEEPLIAIENCSNITFENLIFECTRGMAIYLEGGDNVAIKSSTFRNIGTVAILNGKGINPSKNVPTSREIGSLNEYIYDNATFNRDCGTNHLIENCEIYNTGTGGIILGGGDRISLSKGNNKISNCSIYNFNRHEKTYRGAINIDGVGNIIEYCEIHDCPGVAILLHGNEHLIEYNVIYDAATEGHDMGAFYYGRNPSERGNILRYNLFHHIGNKDGMIVAIYHDDGACGMNVFGNIFYKAGSVAVQIGGGNDIVYQNNIFIDVPLAFHIDNRLQNWANESMIGNSGVFHKRLNEVAIDKSPYMDHYPNLVNYWKDNLGTPKRNIVENNIFCNVGQIHNGNSEWISIGQNYYTDSYNIFTNVGKLDFSILQKSQEFKGIKNFNELPYKKMGRIRK